MKKKNTMVIFSGIFILFFILLCNLLSVVQLDSANYLELTEGWHIEINDKSYDNVSLKDFSFPALDKGDVLVMSCKLPKMGRRILNPILRIYTIHSDIEVKYNNWILYEYGEKLRKENKLLGYGYHFVHVPSHYANATIQLTMHVTENDAFSNLTIPEICNNDVVIRDFVISNRVPLAINLFLVVFGILFLFVGISFCIQDRKFLKLFCVGGFSIGIGCWSICNYDLILLFSHDLQVKAFMEYCSLYVSPLFVLLYFWKDDLVTRNKFFHFGYNALLGAQILFIVLSYGLQGLNIVHFPAMLKIQHIILFILCIGVIVMTITDAIKKQLRNKVLIMGITVMLVVGLVDLFRFSILKYLGSSGDARYSSILCIGTMLFVISQLMDFAMEITDILVKGARAQILEEMAYIDEMTGVANRRRCEDIWNSLDEGNENYGIFAFDLNFLKATNDSMGHAAGDKLIRLFAQCLSTVFEECGTVGRIGGDEFIVFIPNVKNVNIKALTKQLEREIERTNSKNPELKLSTAYGFCTHEEYPEYDSRKIYRRADAIMYENKLAMKAVRTD